MWPLRKRSLPEPATIIRQEIVQDTGWVAGVPPPPDTVLRFEYEYRPKVRFGHGRPPHAELAEVIGRNGGQYRAIIDEIRALRDQFSRIPRAAQAGSLDPFWDNDWFTGLDAMSLYWLLVSRNPRYYFEVGSGNSTKFARHAISHHGLRTQIISVDPHPRAEIDALCDRVIREAFEDIRDRDLRFLGPEDIVFIDNGHRSFQGSDVTVVFLEFLPRLAPGTVVGIHDIFLPADYLDEWRSRFYNEQYLLACALLYGDRVEVVFPVYYVTMQRRLMRRLSALGKAGIPPRGGAFWMRLRQ